MRTNPDALIAETGAVLRPSTAATLQEMYTASYFLGGDDGRERVANDQAAKISPRQGAALHALARGFGSRASLEVGLARGFSTAWIMDALADQPNASHVAIDPFQRSNGRSVGLHTVNRIGLPVSFRHVEARSDDALTTLAREGFTVDFVYIDGNHRFDDVLVDFYLADRIIRTGGLVTLDDMWIPSVRTAVESIASNRSYEPVKTAEPNLAAFRKTREDDRPWDHFVPFRVHGPPGGRAAKAWSRVRRLIAP